MGVDYSSSMLNIADNHACEINNFLKKNGVLQKRNGYLQVGTSKVNGMWECNYKGEKIIIAHINNDLYRIKDIDNFDMSNDNYIKITNVANENETTISGIENKKSFAVFTNDRLYVLCGKYIVLKFSGETTNLVITPCEVYDDEDTYIPTVIKGLTFSTNDLVNQRTLDAINLMSSKIIVSITTLASANITANYNDYTKGQVSRIYNFPYAFKKSIVLPSDFDMTMEIQDDKGERRVLDLYFELNDDPASVATNIYATKASLGSCTSQDSNFVKRTINNVETDCLFIGDISQNALGLLYDFLPPTSDDNITIKYKDKRANEADLINKCTFGIMYGAGGNRNRLFVSGNASQPNVDYHTSRRNIYASENDIDLQDSQDLTYFSVYDYCAYGTSNTKITDYQIMGDGTLMVLKEKSVNEPNIYFRTGAYNKVTYGDTYEAYEERYPLSVGNIGEGSLKDTYGTLRNLNNDIVFLSENGLFGISSTISASVLASDYKYAYGRSRLINIRLNEDVKNSTSIATFIYDNKYYITLNVNGTYKTYVADGRYTYKLGDAVDNEYEYEWFILSNINATQYFTINNKLYYTNDEGLFKLDYNSNVYQDIKQINVERGSLSQIANSIYLNGDILNNLDGVKNELTLDEDLQVYVYNELQPIPSVSGSMFIDVNDSFFKSYLFDKTNKAYLIVDDETDPRKVSEYVEVYLELIEDSNYQYNVYKTSDNSKVTNLGKYDKLVFKASGKKFTIEEEILSGSTKYYALDEYNNKVTFLELNEDETIDTIELTGTFKKYYIVDCKYLTKAFNMGQSLYAKFLRSLTIINDSELNSWVNFGIYTKKQGVRFEGNYSSQDGLAYTYKNLFQSDLTAKKFATSFTKNYTLKFNFIQFEFWNEDENNCVINNLSATYTYGFRTKGANL